MLNFLGEHGEARAEIERWSPASPFERIHRASLAAEIGWQEGGPADLPALASQAAETGQDGSPERLAADGLVAWWSSRTALAAMDPGWQRPLATFRARLGDAANGLHAKALERRTIVLPMIVAVGFVLLGQVAARADRGIRVGPRGGSGTRRCGCRSRSVSPSLTNSGTVTTRPVSIVAFLRAPWAVSPAKPGSVSATRRSTVTGSSTPSVSPW